MIETLVEAIANVREDVAPQLARTMLDAGENPQNILDAGREAMTIVGQRHEQKLYYLPELIIAGDILQQIADLVKPRMADITSRTKPLGTVVIGTVAGDIHDVGKNIVVFLLEVNNFEVYDLGIDVPADKFVEKILEAKPEIVGLSGFLTLAFDQMRDTVRAIEQAALRDSVRIMIGGAPMDEAVTQYVGADAYGENAPAAVRLAREWTGGTKR